MWTSTLVLCYSLAAWTVFTVHVQAICPSGHMDGTVCYRSRPNPATWTDAENDCQRLGGHLMMADSGAKQTTLQRIMAADGLTDVWLGGRLENAQYDKGIWKWVADGTALAAQGCFEERTNSRDLPQRQSLPSVTPATCMTACDSQGYAYAGVQDGNKCFCGNTYGRYQLRHDCTVRCDADVTYKCGGRSSNFVYKVGGTFGRWAYAQPNDFRGYQHCGTISKFVEFKLGDEQCYKLFGYMCNVPSSNCNGGGSSGTTGYLLLGGSCVYVTTTEKTWFAARDDCQARGGDLIKIGSADLQNAITTKLDSVSSSRTYWVGLSRRGWYWASGQPFTFSNWRDQSPDGDGGACLRASDADLYKWSNKGCNDLRAYYCQTDFIETTTTSTTTTTTTTPPTTTTSSPTTTKPVPPTTTKYVIEITTTTTTTTTTKMPTTTTSSPTTTKSVPPTTTKSGQPGPGTTSPVSGVTTPVPAPTTAAPSGGGGNNSAPVPATGKSTGSVGGLSTIELILIVICVILLLLIILIIIVLCYYKTQYRNATVTPEKHGDLRHVASVPFSTPYVIDDGYATNSDYGST
ncbi:hypothetical protein LSAT2_021190, partial [Lamellibrachia satsuma]